MEQNYAAAENIGKQFLQAFCAKDVNYNNFYGNDSMLTFETEQFYGAQNIITKLTQTNINLKPNNYSIQPSNNGIIIYFSGMLNIDGDSNDMPFTRVIFLAQNDGKFYVKNDIYKITFG